MSRRRVPDFFVIGAPKCGTTALTAYLDRHPGIFMAPKEPHFFATDLIADRGELAVGSEAAYLSLFSPASAGQKLGDASVWYLLSRAAPQRIRSFCGSAKIIVMFRNPVDMLYSLHSFLVQTGNEDIASFEEALAAEEDRKRGRRLPLSLTRIPPQVFFYREVAAFSDQIARWLEVFDRRDVHVILFEELRDDPEEMFRQTLRFLDVEEGFVPPFEVVNPGRRRVDRHPQWRRLLRNRVSLGALRRLRRWNVPGLDRLLRKWSRMSHRWEPLPPLDPGLRRRLQAESAGEVRRLGEILGRDLSHWSAGRPESGAAAAAGTRTRPTARSSGAAGSGERDG